MKSEWNEEQIKELLSQLPAVKDHRSPQDIYKRLTMAKRKKARCQVDWPRVCRCNCGLYRLHYFSHFFDQAQPQQKEASQEHAVTKTETEDSPKAATSWIRHRMLYLKRNKTITSL